MITTLALSAAILAQNGASVAGSKAQEIINQARASVGGKDQLKSLRSLSASGRLRRFSGQAQLESDMEVEALFPDKIKITESSPRGVRIVCLNGDQAWSDFIPPSGASVIRTGTRVAPDGASRMQQSQKEEFARLLLGWLLVPPQSWPVKFNYVGEAKSPNGVADVIDAHGPGESLTRLFFDKKTHLLLMLSYKGKRSPRRQMALSLQVGRMPSAEELRKLSKEAEEAAAKAPEVELRWSFADYKDVNGLRLAHRITKYESGNAYEEYEVSQFKLNQLIRPEKFKGKEGK
jgi:hypothetical protein